MQSLAKLLIILVDKIYLMEMSLSRRPSVSSCSDLSNARIDGNELIRDLPGRSRAEGKELVEIFLRGIMVLFLLLHHKSATARLPRI